MGSKIGYDCPGPRREQRDSIVESKRIKWPERFAHDGQALATGRQDPQSFTAGHQGVGDSRHFRDHVLAVVEDQQRAALNQKLTKALQRSCRCPRTGLGPNVQRSPNCVCHSGGVTDRGEIDEPDPISKVSDQCSPDFDSEPGLSHAAGSDDGHKAIGTDGGCHGLEIMFPSDESIRCEREIAHSARSPFGRR